MPAGSAHFLGVFRDGQRKSPERMTSIPVVAPIAVT
jgi:hypothetical protein